MAVYVLRGRVGGPKVGDFVVGRGEEQRVYKEGDCVESDEDLIELHPNKFELAPAGTKDKFAAVEEKPKKSLRKQEEEDEDDEDSETMDDISEDDEEGDETTGEEDEKEEGDEQKPKIKTSRKQRKKRS